MAQTGYTPILIYSSSTTSNAPAAGSLTNSTLGSELAINITDGKLFYKDNANAIQVIAWKTTPTTAGGTGLTSYTAGDLLYYATGTTLAKLGIGANKTILTSSGTAPQWSTSLDTTQGGTGVTSYTAGDLIYYASSTAFTKLGIGSAYQALQVNAGGTAPSWQASATSTLTDQGDLLYASAANTLARLAKNTTATRYLANTGTSNNPAWAQVDLSNGVTGTLPVANGGTGTASYTANRILYASGATTISTSAGLTFDGTNFATTGTASATKLIPTGGAATGNGMYLPTTNTLGFSTNGAQAMTLDASGNLGLGATSISAIGSGYTTQSIQGTNGAGVRFYAGSTEYGRMYADSGGMLVMAINSTPLVFHTGGSERARITSDGLFLIRTATQLAGSTGSFQVTSGGSDAIVGQQTVSANNVLALWNSATTGDNVFSTFYTDNISARGSIDYNRTGGLTRYNTTSDATLKNIFGDADGERSLEILNTTRLREYAWKNDPEQNKQVGVIAQELYETYKGAVSVGGDIEKERDVTEEVEEEYTDEEGNTQIRTVTKVIGKETYTEYRPWGVDKTAFTFHLIAGWQAHEKKIAEQQARIETLEAQNVAFEARLAALEVK